MRTMNVAVLLAVALARQNVSWTIAPNPTVAIGTEDGPEPTQLSRVYGALRLPDGTIIVGNSASGEMRFFAANGTHIRSAGRTGAGPGEIARGGSVIPVAVGGDQLYISDGGNQRVNTYDLTGRFIRTFRLAVASDKGLTSLAAVAGKTIVGSSLMSTALDGPPGSIINMTFHYGIFDSTGALVRPLFDAAAQPRYVHEHQGSTHYPFIPYSPKALVVARNDKVYLLRNTAPEIEVWSVAGQRTATFIWPAQRTEVRTVWPQYKADALAAIAKQPPNGFTQLNTHLYQIELPLPKLVPIADQLHVDANGNLWIARYRLPGNKDRRWDVLDERGKFIATVTTPLNFEVFQIGADFILGRTRDDLDVEHVQLHALRK